MSHLVVLNAWTSSLPSVSILSAVLISAEITSLLGMTAISLCLLLWKGQLNDSRIRILSVAVFLMGLVHVVDAWQSDQYAALATTLMVLLVAVLLLIITATSRPAVTEETIKAQASLAAAQEELSREQYLMACLVDSLPDSIYFKDADSRFIRCNQRTADVFQLSSPDDAIGRSDYDFFSREEADEYREDELRIMQTGDPVINKQEYELWPDGEYHWVLSTKLPLRDLDQNIIGTFGLSRDISDLKRAQQGLAKKVEELESLHAEFTREQKLFSTLIENIPDAVFFKDRDSRFIRVNPAMARDAGFQSPEEMIGLSDTDVWGTDLASDARTDEIHIMETGEPIIGKQEAVHRRNDVNVRWVLATKMPLKDFGDEIIGTFGLARDITTLCNTQQWLADSQERFELAAQGTNDGLWDWDVESDEVWYSPRFRELLEFSADSAGAFPNLLSSFSDRLHSDDRLRVMQSIQDHLAGGRSHDEEYRLQVASGEYRWFRGRGQAEGRNAGKPVRMAGSIQDIHERYLAELELQRVQLQLRQALQGGNVGMWDWDVLTDQVEVSPEIMIQIGESPDHPWTTLKDWEDRLHPDDVEAAKNRTWEYIEGLRNEYESSFRLRHASGNYRWMLSRGKLFRNDIGVPRRFIGVHVDVTELRETQAALAESEARFRGIFNQTFQFIGLLTPDGEVVDANQTAMAGAGISPEEVIGRKFWDTVWWSHSEALQNRLKEAVDKAAAGGFDRFEAIHPGADGSSINVDFSLKPVFNEAGDVVYLIPEGRDVTQLRQYQDDLKERSEELEHSNRELEQFAYVASHDLQEPLRTIVGFCQLLETEFGQQVDETGQMYIETIVEGGRRMQQLITDLLEFSRVGRRGKPLVSLSLQQIAEQAQALLHSAITDACADVQVESLPTIHGDPGQLVRVFQNLIGNAVKYRRDVPPRIRLWSEQSEDEWNVFISDNGIGIPVEFVEQVFIIFRRLHTRDEYPGTGIGLAICRRILDRHHGQIQIATNHAHAVSPDHGVTFQLTFPAPSLPS